MPNPMLAIAGSTVIGAGASLAAGQAQAGAAKEATAAQTELGEKQIALSREIFESGKKDQKPWLDFGVENLAALKAGIKDGSFSMDGWKFEADPGYQFRMDEGTRALDRSAAAQGRALSGDHLRNVLQYNQNFASNEYDRAYSREAGAKNQRFNIYATGAGVGQTANAANQQAGQAFVNQTGQTSGQIGSAIATGAYRTGQAYADMYGGIAQSGQKGISNYLLYQMMGA